MADPNGSDAMAGPPGSMADHGETDGHDDHAHTDEDAAPGPVDIIAWGAAGLGIAAGLVVAFVLALSSI